MNNLIKIIISFVVMAVVAFVIVFFVGMFLGPKPQEENNDTVVVEDTVDINLFSEPTILIFLDDILFNPQRHPDYLGTISLAFQVTDSCESLLVSQKLPILQSAAIQIALKIDIEILLDPDSGQTIFYEKMDSVASLIVGTGVIDTLYITQLVLQ